tara:strand:- start:1074 stop:1274 length:201 start_codon:yes stop_codon:yes gene_type:complete
MSSLFEKQLPKPLVEMLRPKSLDEVIGQEHLIGAEGSLRHSLRSGQLFSMILWGSPRTGKTAIAKL